MKSVMRFAFFVAFSMLFGIVAIERDDAPIWAGFIISILIFNSMTLGYALDRAFGVLKQLHNDGGSHD